MAAETRAGPAVRAVLFDAGNTLLRVRRSVGAVYAAAARRHGANPGGDELDARFRAEFARRRASFLPGVSRPHSPTREKIWWRSLVAEVCADVPGLAATDAAFPAFFEDLYREFEKPDHWRLFADVLPCLQALRARGLPLAVVSNWDSRLHSVLAGLGVTPSLRFVLTSAEFGAEKPDPAIFREAVARLGLEPAQVLHVGDTLVDDVRGARAAGLQTLWLRREVPNGPAAAEPAVSSLTAVVELALRGAFAE